MTTNQRGCRNLLIFLVFAFFGCILIPFIVLPAASQAVTLPVISVPAEPYLKGWGVFGVELVNSLGGAVLAMVIVFAIALVARRHSKGWTKEVPGRFQALVEMIVDGLWGLTKAQAGDKPRVRNLLFPLVASLFLFLLAANWGKLLPGVETVGVLHCAIYEPSAKPGFPVHEVSFLGRPYFVVRSENPLNIGTMATLESYDTCEAVLGVTKYQKYLPKQLDPFLDRAVTYTTVEGDTVNSIVARFNDEVTAKSTQELPDLSNYIDIPYEGWKPLTFTAADIIANNTAEDGTVTLQLAAGSTDTHAADDGHSKIPAGAVMQQAEATPEAATGGHGDTHGEGAAHSAEPVAVVSAATFDADAALAPGQTVVVRPELLGAEATTLHNQLFMVTPFVRGLATDLSFTIGLALLAFFAIQFFGVSELGLNYFQKFINIHAVGNIAKKPLGAIDFVVGLFEIISEFGKIISLSFRLFGAIFAGTVLFAVIMFLVGTTIPAIILLLEIIVGFAQAAVFAILTLIFCSQAMVSHIHDDDHGHAEAHH
jgi:F0F1-type ATP synthase membrane subunit a